MQQAVEMVSSVGTIRPLFVFDQAQHNSGIIWLFRSVYDSTFRRL